MIKECAAYITKQLQLNKPKIAIILGSGLGDFTKILTNTTAISYQNIPGFPESTVSGHKGELIKGYLKNKEILCLNGRFHLYEGHDPSTIRQVIHTLKELGIETLIITNAAGSLKKELNPGSLMLIKDHINFSGRNPLVGPNNDAYGPRFPAINNAYTPALRKKCKIIAAQQKISINEGVYLMVLGPNYETAAEVRAFGILGADAVGMSTVPEAIVASHCSMNVLGISVITNYAAGLMENTPSHEETLQEAQKASRNLIRIISDLIAEED